MGKNKDKKAKKTSDVLLEMSPYSSYLYESPQQLTLSTDTESSVQGSPKQLEMLTCSSEKYKKKQKKKDLAAQAQENFKKPKKRRKSRGCETPSNKPAELHLTDMVDGLAAEMSHHEEPTRKKKKKDKLRQTEETVTHDVSESDVLRKKEKKKRSIDKVQEMNVTLKSDENEMMSNERTGDSGKKKKKNKEKENHLQIFESAASSAQSVQENGFNASTGTGEKQAENLRVKEKKDKKRKDKEKKNLIEILESEKLVKESGSIDPQTIDKVIKSTEPAENQNKNVLIQRKKEKKMIHKEKQIQPQISGSATTAAARSVQQSGSTHLQETEDVNISTEPEEIPTKKRKKKNEAKHKNSVTQQTQTTQKQFVPKTEQTECSVNERVQIGTRFVKKTKNKRVSKEIDGQLLEEIKQFVPNVESRLPVDINKMINYDLPRYKEFKKMGIPLNHGRFTVNENEVLKKNVEDFLALTGIDSGTKLFYTDRFEDKSAIKKLKRNHRFYEVIATGIPRSCHDVYTRGRKIFSGSECKGIFTKSELHQLCKLQTLHGNNWKKISELTGRSAVSLEKRYSHLTKRVGMWSNKELQMLLRAVRDYIISEVQPRPSNIDSLRVSREMLYKGLPWRNISEKVKTRSWNKCREKWLSVLSGKMSSGAVYKGDANEAKVKLIKAMYQMQVEDVADVNWDKLSALFGDVPPFYVQKKWNRLKICYVPNWQSKCFADIIDFLYEQVLPCLEAEVISHADHDLTQLKENQAKTFLLSDIFQDINDQDTDDDERGGGGDE